MKKKKEKTKSQIIQRSTFLSSREKGESGKQDRNGQALNSLTRISFVRGSMWNGFAETASDKPANSREKETSALLGVWSWLLGPLWSQLSIAETKTLS